MYALMENETGYVETVMFLLLVGRPSLPAADAGRQPSHLRTSAVMFPPRFRGFFLAADPKALPVMRFIHGVDRAGPVRLVDLPRRISITFAKFMGRENGGIVQVAPVARPQVLIIPPAPILAFANHA